MKFNNINVHISDKATIGENVKIGDNTSIYDNVHIGDNTIIAENCIIGEPQNAYYSDDNYIQPKTIIGENSLVRSYSVIYAGSTFGKHFQTGHRVVIREETFIGDFCSVGTLADIQGYSRIGNYCRFQSNIVIAQYTTIGNFVFTYPYVILANDPCPPSLNVKGPEIDDFVQIATHAVILPGVKIGKHALIGASSTVSRDVQDFDFIMGTPGKRVCDVREIKSKDVDQTPMYPWPYRFDRGMPWEKIGFDNWNKINSDD